MNININKSVLIDGLIELSSRKVQESCWAKAIKGEVHTFEEAACNVFDDSGVGLAMDKGNLGDFFSESIGQKFEELRKYIFSIPGEKLSPEEVIEHPKMCDVRRVSSEILNALKE